MSPETVGAGWVLVGAVLVAVGVGIIAWVRWSKPLPARPPVSLAEFIANEEFEVWEAIMCGHMGGRPRPNGLDYCCTRMLGHAGIHAAYGESGRLIATWSERLAGLVSVAPVIPLQRDGRDS